MVNDFKKTRSATPLKSSNHLSNTIEKPSDESPLGLINTTGISTNPTGITSPPPFYTKRPDKMSKITRFKFLPKRKQYSNQKLHTDQSEPNTSSSLPHYSSVTTNANDYPLTASPNYLLKASSVTYEMNNPV